MKSLLGAKDLLMLRLCQAGRQQAQLAAAAAAAGDEPQTLALECNQNDLERLDDCRLRRTRARASSGLYVRTNDVISGQHFIIHNFPKLCTRIDLHTHRATRYSSLTLTA